MTTRTRILVLGAAALAALYAALISLLRMLVPGFLEALPTSLLGRLGDGVELAAALTGALVVLLAAALALAAERTGRPAVPRSALRATVVLAGALLAVTTPGGVIPLAGYTFAATVLIGVVVFVVLTVLRRPGLGILLAVLVGGPAAYAVMVHDAASLVPPLISVYGAVLSEASVALAHVAAAAGMVVWIVTDPASTPGAIGAFVLRHRVVITVIAAACALPYAVARASWLTPWPAFGGGAEMFEADPSVRVLGLLLGLGMLTGGVLTLGLVLPWGERFPRYLAGLGGRPVPVALAVIPATLVSVLFTAAGIEFAIEGAGPAKDTLSLLLIFPFWLWGPLLGLATRAYAMRRREQVATGVDGITRAGEMHPSGRAMRRAATDS